jgi:hypothetical protein
VSVDLCRQHASRHCFFFFSSSFVRSFSSLHSAGLLLADLSFVFVKSVYQSVSIPPLVGFCLFPFFFFVFGYYLLLPFWVGGAIVSEESIVFLRAFLFYFIWSAPCEEEEEEEEEEPL